jgi:hypothetical protein
VLGPLLVAWRSPPSGMPAGCRQQQSDRREPALEPPSVHSSSLTHTHCDACARCVVNRSGSRANQVIALAGMRSTAFLTGSPLEQRCGGLPLLNRCSASCMADTWPAECMRSTPFCRNWLGSKPGGSTRCKHRGAGMYSWQGHVPRRCCKLFTA